MQVPDKRTGLRSASWVVDVVVVVVAFLLGGALGLVVGALGQAASRYRGPKFAAAGAFAALVLASVATAATPWHPPDVLFTFPKDHRVAAEAARLAGVLLFVALVGFARAERSGSAAVVDPYDLEHLED